jgi:hypothetical protein
MKMDQGCRAAMGKTAVEDNPFRLVEARERELHRLSAELEAVKEDRNAWRESALAARDEKLLQGCLGNGRTGLIRAMRDAFAGTPRRRG